MNTQPTDRRRTDVIWATVALIAAAVASFMIVSSLDDPGPQLRGAAGSDRVGPVGAVRLVAAMPKSATTPATPRANPSVHARVPDSKIAVDIEMKLRDMGLPADRLDVTVDDGQVVVEGAVETTLLRDAVEITVRSVAGVRAVDNRLQVIQ